jgi:hypothetical protein
MKQRVKGERASAGLRLAPGVAILGAALSLATLPACGGSNQPTGSLYVMVLDKSMSPVADAEVTTDPATQSLVTDALGTVFFPKIPAAGYAVTASHPTAGWGRATAQVVANEVADAVITLTRPPVDGGAGGQAGGPDQGGRGGVVGTGGLPGSSGRAGEGGPRAAARPPRCCRACSGAASAAVASWSSSAGIRNGRPIEPWATRTTVARPTAPPARRSVRTSERSPNASSRRELFAL